MKNSKIQAVVSQFKAIRNSWTMNHPREIVIMTLIVVVLIQAYGEQLNATYIRVAEAMTYEQNITRTVSIPEASRQQRVEAKAEQMLKRNTPMLLEQYRQEAIEQELVKLLELAEVSPYVDYDELREQYGY